MEHSESKLFLTSIECIGYKTIDRIIEKYSDYDAFYNLKEEDILKCEILNDNQIKAVINAKKTWNLDKYMKCLERNNINIITRENEEYPQKLLTIPDPPFQLFYCGELPKEDTPSVAIIGARNCSEYGKQCAKYFAGGLAHKGIQIISGLATGIDGIAQNEAISNGGKSYGILGCGANICYPRSNYELYNKVIGNGGIITEFPPDSKPLAMHFPMRNRIISGLADIVLVIEAKEKSGTAITVNMALEQGREVFAVPGRINDRLSDGCNRLIAEGSGIARRIDDIIDALGLQIISNDKNNCGLDRTRLFKDKTLSEMAVDIGKVLIDKNCTIDELLLILIEKHNDITVQDIRLACFELEYAGYVKDMGGILTVV